MRREKLITALWAMILGFLLSFSAVAGLASAFDMQVSLKTLACACFAASFFGAVCYSLPLGLLPPASFALVLGFYYRTGALERSVESLLYRLSRQYSQGYGWPINRWSGRISDQMEQTLPLILCIIGIWIAFSVCRGICRKKSVIFGVIPSLLCLSACLVVNDTAPDTVFLFTQIVCLIVLLLTCGVRRRDASQGNRLTLVTLPVTALALLVLFACVPRQDYSSENAKKFSRWFTESEVVQTLLGHTADTQAEDGKVDLTQVGYQMEGKTRVMDVKADFTATLYLRSRALDYYDGASWTKGTIYDFSDLSWPSDLETAGMVEISTNFAHSMLYVPYYAASSNMRESTYGVTNGNKLTEYSFATLKVPDISHMQQYQQDSSGLWRFMSQYISLPEEVQKWAAPVANKLMSENYNVPKTAQNIADYVRNSAKYDTNTPRMPHRDGDFAQWFLEESDTGYCVHFATATTVLLQAAGIPARYVTGYMVQVVKGQAVEVTGQQAHAWCEYWLPGYGWTVLESTPPDLRAEQLEETLPVVTEPSELPEPITPIDPQNPVTQPQIVTVTKNIWPFAVLIVALVALVWGQYSLRKLLGVKHRQKGSTNAQTLAHWQYAEILAKHLNEAPPEQLQTLAEKAKFSQYAITAEELAVFAEYEAGAFVALKKKNIFMQIYYRLILALY